MYESSGGTFITCYQHVITNVVVIVIYNLFWSFVAEWLWSFGHWLRIICLCLTTLGSNSAKDFRFFHVRKLSRCLRNFGGSTQVPARAWNNVRRGHLGSSSNNILKTLELVLESALLDKQPDLAFKCQSLTILHY